jgi:hypothetical protein
MSLYDNEYEYNGRPKIPYLRLIIRASSLLSFSNFITSVSAISSDLDSQKDAGALNEKMPCLSRV